uniref:Uncharacterized protein n=1 Tax=Wolbachia endosymbiont of Aleurodicus floccissimus TaxID=2152762 RepID=A0A3B0J0X0_9RICK
MRNFTQRAIYPTRDVSRARKAMQRIKIQNKGSSRWQFDERVKETRPTE